MYCKLSAAGIRSNGNTENQNKYSHKYKIQYPKISQKRITNRANYKKKKKKPKHQQQQKREGAHN